MDDQGVEALVSRDDVEERVGELLRQPSEFERQDEVEGVVSLSLHGHFLHAVAEGLELFPEFDRDRFLLCVEEQHEAEVLAGDETRLFGRHRNVFRVDEDEVRFRCHVAAIGMVGFESFYLFFRYTIRSQKKPAQLWHFICGNNGRNILQVITETELQISQFIELGNRIDIVHGTAVQFKIPQLFTISQIIHIS